MQISYRAPLLLISMACTITSHISAGEQPSALSRALRYYDAISPTKKVFFAVIALPVGIVTPTLMTANDIPQDGWNYYTQPHVLGAACITLTTATTIGFMAIREINRPRDHNQENETLSRALVPISSEDDDHDNDDEEV